MRSERDDIYTRITNKIVEQLERGVTPWSQPWQAGHAAGAVSKPLRANGEPYKGVNVLSLWISAMEKGFDNPLWLTYNQAQELGGQVRKGEKGSLVVYANTFTKKEQNDKGEDVEKEIPFLKGYTVFNAQQIDGLPEKYYARAEPKHSDPIERIEHAEQFFANTKADIKHGGSQAFYSPSSDYIQMPDIQAFRDKESYYATLAHEMSHWTRHPSRLDRDFGRQRFGDAGYAMEELVAEIGSAFTCADLGITPEPRENHAAYLASWLKVLKNDPKAIFTAASHAQKAADHLHGYQPERERDDSYEKSAAAAARPQREEPGKGMER